jgi:hypothetical protein
MAPIFTGSKFGFGGGAAGPAGPFSATGGTKISEPDGYTYHYFTASGPNPFNVSQISEPGSVDYVIIGSGGAGCGQPAGNNYGGGGGGAGGVRTGSITASVQNYTFNVAGITTALSANYLGVMGSPSSAFGVDAQGGGSGGGYAQATVETNGGSGGGQSSYEPTVGLGNRVTGTTTPAPAQGNNGGTLGSAPNTASGGGGGAGGVGGNSSGATGGAGGNGTAFPTWTIPPSYGTPGPNGSLRYFAGGGGGGGNSAAGLGSYGGGGAGASSASATPGTVNTGGGGGSTGGNGTLNGGSGGSGIIIVRYLT